MFDLPDFEEDLRKNLDLFTAGPLIFHEPVWGVEHTAPKGSAAWEETQYHLGLTRKYASILHPLSMVYHLNNCVIPAGEKDRMLRTSLENLEKLREAFPDVRLLVENTGIREDGTQMLDQEEFTDLCRNRRLSVLIDVGHANVNGWNLTRLIEDLKDQIAGFHLHNNDGVCDLHNRLRNGTLDIPVLISVIDRLTPHADRIIEYTRDVYHGEPLLEDICYLQSISRPQSTGQNETETVDSMDTELNMSRLKYVFQNMVDAALATRMNGELIYANPAAKKLFGLAGRKTPMLWETIPHIEENDALYQLLIDGIVQKKKNITSLVDYVNRDGKLYHLHVSLTCDAEESGVFLIVVSDLTELMKVSSAFKRYTSPEIANYVLTSPGGEKQGGTDREVTILMSDIRGFTALSSRLSCTDLITMLNHYFECMSLVIDRYHGTIIEFLGDGLFVVFGAPKDQSDHAADAVSCAITMQNAMEDVNEWNRTRGYPELEMGIGIHSGIAVVGNIGSDKRMKYGCMGEVVNLAGRLESYTVGGQVFVSEDTVLRLPEKPEIIDSYQFIPKGAREGFAFCSVTGLGKEHLQQSFSAGMEWVSLPKGREIVYFILDGKTVTNTEHTGLLVRVSADDRSCMLVSDKPFEQLQNVMLQISDHKIYAKVIGKADDGYILCFTSKDISILDLCKKGKGDEFSTEYTAADQTIPRA